MTVTQSAPNRRPRRRPAQSVVAHPLVEHAVRVAPERAVTEPGQPIAAAPVTGGFANLGLPAPLLAVLAKQGLTTPFPIQAATIPDALAGRDVLGRGQTGSGKTLAFGLPLLARIAGRRAQPGRPLALVLVPTRELAAQVTASLAPYAAAMRLKSATVVGGLSIGAQANALRNGVELLVATPGRLTDLVNRGDCRLDQIAIAVVDEADQMADIGFLPQVTRLLKDVPAGGQRMLFSATLDRGVDRLVQRFLANPVTHSVNPPKAATVSTMTHHLLQVDLADKQPAVAEIAARDGRVIMFVDTKHGAERLAKHLLSRGVHAAALHGGKSQGQRTRALEGFRTGAVTALVATNVAARGIHIDDLDLVVNVDPPADGKDYLHRGGRTARAGQSGTVVTLVLPHQRREVSRLMSAAGIRAECVTVHAGHPELARVTGARTPTDIAVAPVTAISQRRVGESGARPASATRARRRGPRHA
ncbi:superfamily II DNA/RNA helicase [Allocatelliglobosispora scoriae]|uniref:Superfamily II DNA/RNA helicase n=1 Tax=Allocatelliglobosispora scoriae TaxID=643052 RepID=A0A841BZK6_9ACTN|nr:DEAD/DEAH box helicase [Allocatelliglobosispora scoriae]MBB5872529.1 superfamily II DNA/RNA helicase [Allocatelliglobosispora scoriae]